MIVETAYCSHSSDLQELKQKQCLFACLFTCFFFFIVGAIPPLFSFVSLSPSPSPSPSPFPSLSYPLPPSKMFVGGLSWQTSEGEAELLIPCIEAFQLEEFDSSIKLVFISGFAFSGVAGIQSIAGGHISEE